MRAELAGIESGPAQWSFILGCIRVALSQLTLGMAGRAAATAAAIGATVALASGTGYAPLRLALIAYVTLPVAIAWTGRLPSLAPG